MTIDQADSWLSRYRWLSKMVDEQEQELAEMREKLGLKGQALDAVIVSGTKDPHKYDRLAEYAYRLSMRIQEQNDALSEIDAVIDAVESDRLKLILYMYYIRGYFWDDIAKSIDISIDSKMIYKLRTEALTIVASILDSVLQDSTPNYTNSM